MFKIFRKPESYGKSKLDHILTHVSYGLKDACVLVGLIALTYVAVDWTTDFLAFWIYRSFM